MHCCVRQSKGYFNLHVVTHGMLYNTMQSAVTLNHARNIPDIRSASESEKVVYMTIRLIT